MELSKRLFAVASMITPGSKVADIGTDHAYIPIYLMQEKLCSSAIAMDVNEGPLERASEHIMEAGFQASIETRLSNGFAQLKAFEAESAIIAGMGGGLVMKILSQNPEVTCSLKECVLQPQSEIAKVRSFLLNNGFLISEEDMVIDEGKYYPMMKVIPPQEWNGQEVASENKTIQWSETELRYGKHLLEKKHPVLKEFLLREEQIQLRILDGLVGKAGEKIEQRRLEISRDLEYIKKGLEYYAV